jgi:hypothetical protein
MPSGCNSDAGCACSDALSFSPRTGTKPARSHSPIGFVTSGTPMVQSTLAGARTS